VDKGDPRERFVFVPGVRDVHKNLYWYKLKRDRYKCEPDILSIDKSDAWTGCCGATLQDGSIQRIMATHVRLLAFHVASELLVHWSRTLAVSTPV